MSDIFVEYVQKAAKTGLQKGIFPYTIEACICLDHMQMRIHGLALVGILLAQAHVLDRVPCTGERPEIAVFLLVETVLLDRMEQLYGILQRLGIACRSVEFGEAVDRECYRIYLLLCVKRSVVCIQ